MAIAKKTWRLRFKDSIYPFINSNLIRKVNLKG